MYYAESWNSSPARKAANRRFSNICYAARPQIPRRGFSAASTSAHWWLRWGRGARARRASGYRPRTCWPRCRICRSSTRSRKSSMPNPKASAPRRWSSHWRPCTWPNESTRCPGRAKPFMAKGHSSRYSAYTGGPDPLAPPVDLREALEQIGQDVMGGPSPRRALSELLRRGTKNMPGADRLAAEANRRRRDLLRRNNLDGTLQEIKKLLDEAVLAERKELARALDDDARFGELQLDALPASPAKAVEELSDYNWRSAEARQKYEQIKDLLGREMLDQRFAGMKQALEGATDEDRQRVNEMLDDLNELLDKHSRGEDTQRDFDEFMGKHGEFFPENPRNVDELLDSLAERAAAAQRFRNSLSPDQRAELDALAQQAFGSPALMQALNRLDAHLQAARPGEDWTGSQEFSGDNPFGMGEGTQALSDIAELEQLAEQLSQSYPGATMDDVDLDALARQLGDQAAIDARTLAELERALVNQGFLDRGSDGQWRLSPKAMRRLGETALRDVAEQLSSRHGERDHRRAGAAGELTGGTRPWQFGDTEPWNISRSLTNAVLRQAGTTTVGGPIRITARAGG